MNISNNSNTKILLVAISESKTKIRFPSLRNYSHLSRYMLNTSGNIRCRPFLIRAFVRNEKWEKTARNFQVCDSSLFTKSPLAKLYRTRTEKELENGLQVKIGMTSSVLITLIVHLSLSLSLSLSR